MGKKRDDVGKRSGAAGRRQARVAVGGVRTRAVTARRKAVASASAEEDRCYLRLRSRRLYFMPAAAVSRESLGAAAAETRAPSPLAVELLGGSAAEAMAGTGISRSASTASSADVGARERIQRSGGAGEVCTQAGEDRDEESSVGDSGCYRERRETTPSSRPPGDSSDTESNHAAEEQKLRHRVRSSTTSAVVCHSPARTSSIRMPPVAAEIEEFLAAAERAKAERFAAKYNFDVVRGVPLDAGRFEWTAVGSG